MTNERWTCPDKHDFIWASGVYLTKKLPQTFDQWDDAKLEKFISKYACIEHLDRKPCRIWEDIDACAYALKKYFLEKTENSKKLSKAPKKYFIDIGDEYSHYNWNAEFVEYRYKSNGETVKEEDS